MQDAVIDRLAKIVSDPPRGEGPQKKRHVPDGTNVLARFQLAEGWFTFFLLALVVYSSIWCVQVVGWADHLSLLTPITALGLIFGVIASKQRRLPRLLIHTVAFIVGVLLTFWQTSSVDYAGNFLTFFGNLRLWFALIFSQGTSSDDSVFLFLILILGFLLAYTSTWLLYRTRSPWLMLLANAVVLLINLSSIDASYVIFLIIYLSAALLLLLRFNLYESSSRWKRLGLRCSEDLNWEFMQAGALLSLGVLIVSWLLPWGYTNQAAAQVWNADTNPWNAAQNAWNRLLAVNSDAVPQNHGNFANLLTLGGNPNLTNTPVFRVKTDDGTQYLLSISYDQYDGARNWSNSSQENDLAALANSAPITDGSAYLRQVTQTITVLNPPGEQYPYLFAASQIVSTNQNTHLEANMSDGETTAWLRDNGKLAAGNVYTALSDVSAATIQDLRDVPLPANAPQLPQDYGTERNVPLTYFDPNVLNIYTKLPSGLDNRIKTLALQLTANSKTMYDKLSALENYLRSNYTYDATITAPPPGQEATSWFLFQEKRGYCNYFASAMVLMARELGIPARLAAGYTDGKIDSATGLWTVTGTDAHAWAQVYFAGYGWINFEPTATFALFTRPVASSSSTAVTPGPSSVINPNKRHLGNDSPLNTAADHNAGSTVASDAAAQVRVDVGVVLLLLVVFILGGWIYFSFWWRRLFRGLSLPSQIYGRVCILAGWAGISLNRSQTPHEYMQAVAAIAPEEAVTFERLGDIYARERWADPASPEHPVHSGEIAQIPQLWKSLQPHLRKYVVRHPHFLRQVPATVREQLRHRLRPRSRSESTVVVEEELK